MNSSIYEFLTLISLVVIYAEIIFLYIQVFDLILIFFLIFFTD